MAKVEGVDQLQRKLARLAAKADDGQLLAALLAGAKAIENEAVRLAPVDKGLLRSSIHSEAGRAGGGLIVRIGTNVEYSIYQEFGTSRMRAQPFLRPAFDANRRAALETIRRALQVMVRPE